MIDIFSHAMNLSVNVPFRIVAINSAFWDILWGGAGAQLPAAHSNRDVEHRPMMSLTYRFCWLLTYLHSLSWHGLHTGWYRRHYCLIDIDILIPGAGVTVDFVYFLISLAHYHNRNCIQYVRMRVPGGATFGMPFWAFWEPGRGNHVSDIMYLI